MNRDSLGPCILVLLILLLTTKAFGQAGDTLWTRTYGGTAWDYGYSVQQTRDGGYIIAGYTLSFGTGGDVYLIKTDAGGDTLWTRTYGGTAVDCGWSVQQTTDGGYIIAGYTWSFGAGYSDLYLIKTDTAGDTVWTRTYGGTAWDYGHSVQQTKDDGYIVAGSTESFGPGGDVYLIKTDAGGDTVWTRTYGGTSSDWGYSVQQTRDGGYIVAGETYSYGLGGDVYLIKTDAGGDTVWTRTYGGTSEDYGYSVQQTTDGGYIITGYTYSFGADGDVYLIKTDAGGDTLWTRAYGGTAEEDGLSVQQTTDGGCIIAGYTNSFGAGYSDVYLIKTDAGGDTLWTRTYGGTYDDRGNSVQQTTDGGCIVAGYTYSFGVGESDVYLIKMAPVFRPVPGTLSNENIYVCPNPFDPGAGKANFRFRLARGGDVSIKVYDASNKLVATVVSGIPVVAEYEQSVEWTGMNDKNQVVSNGVYFYVIECSSGERGVGKLAVLR